MIVPARVGMAALLSGLAFTAWPAEAVIDDGVVPITGRADRQRLTHQFERSLAAIGWKLRLECRTMFGFPVSGRPGSIGALCQPLGLPAARPILLCDDFGVGKLTVQAAGGGISDETLITFTRQNCPSGG